MARDPVCGMRVQEKQAANKLDYQGKTYYFCTPLCMVTFQNDPEKYSRKKQKPKIK
jgi:YHS domain-containing protein